MDAEEFKVEMSQVEDPKDLDLVELVRHIVCGEKFITQFETMHELAEDLTKKKREFTPEQNCFLETVGERLKLLYVELVQRAERYRDY